MNLDSSLASIVTDADRAAAVLEQGGASAAVAACPGWDVLELCFHLGGVHRWATHAIVHAEAPERSRLAMPEHDLPDDDLAAWLRAGAGDLVDALRDRPGDAETWHPFPLEQRMWVWARRQAIETMLHRWDAEVAATGTSSLDVDLAIDGVHEYLELHVARVFTRDGVAPPTTSVHLHATDEGLTDGRGEWLVWHDGDRVQIVTEHRKGDPAVRAPAADLLLALMGRADREALDVVGDEAAAAEWLDLPDW